MSPSFKSSRIALVGAIGVSVAIAISSFSVVRAQRFSPLGSISYTCKGAKGSACVTGNSTGQSWGVLGASTHNHGVVGESAALGKAGVAGYGLATGPGGFGVYAESADTTGKYAALDAQGDATGTNLFYAYNHANNTSCLIDSGSNMTCTGTLKASPLGASADGVVGQATNGYGIKGISSKSVGVHGETTSNMSSAGVEGIASSGIGVYGNSSGNVGVLGVSTAAGVAAVEGLGSANGNGALAVGGPFGLVAETNSTSGFALYAAGVGSNSGSCVFNFYGDESCTGTIMGGQDILTRHRTHTGRNILAHAAQSTSATIEDLGTARLVDGTAMVRIDSSFVSTIDGRQPYYVFLTPLGDTRGLYVSEKTPSAFVVHETQHGHSTLGFDYRIVAHPVDAGNDRLPTAPPVHVPSPQLAKPPKLPPL